ncbi:MAG TPA: phenylalanine--tRNA ligase subunit beta, partial [Chitinophagaceae bacterium]|nr:phenylalanine--tRNA ligase subunit beta [Chitinophagaceae bacterium]
QSKEKKQVAIKYHYLKKISGKNYHPDAVKNILTSLGFEVLKEGIDELRFAVPFHKPDISLPADLVEEVLRIDGLDNVEIPESITITPAIEENQALEAIREKVANYLVGLGYNEIMTNSITNAAYFSEEEQKNMVKMMNSLSAELDILRNSLFETALQVVAHNLNHRNNSLRLFEFGKAYSTNGPGLYQEEEKLCIAITGNTIEDSWNQKNSEADFYYLKGMVTAILKMMGINPDLVEPMQVPKLDNHIVFKLNLATGEPGGQIIAGAGQVSRNVLTRFDIKQPVFFAGLNWTLLAELAAKQNPAVSQIPRFPAVQRDIAMIVPKQLQYEAVEKTVQKIRLPNLRNMKLFDIFESEKLGAGKKSMAMSFTFLDDEKTLTDKEIDGWMNKIMVSLEKELNAEIRKSAV